MGWSTLNEQYASGEELYQDEIKYTWGSKFAILKHKVVGKKKGHILELVKNIETQKIMAHRTIFTIDGNGSSYKHVDLGCSVPKEFIDGMTAEYQEMYKQELVKYKEAKKRAKEEKDVFKKLGSGQIIELKNGRVLEFVRHYSSQRFVAKIHNSEDKTEYGWHYKNISHIVEKKEEEMIA